MDLHRSPLTVEIARRTLAEAMAADLSGDAAAPIQAGMRARAVADACEALKLAAILIDGTGRVLHVGAIARGVLGDTFDVVAGHLVGRTQAANRAVQQAVMAAIGLADAADPSAGGSVAGVPYRDPSPVQMLRGILILRSRARATRAGLATLRTMLPA